MHQPLRPRARPSRSVAAIVALLPLFAVSSIHAVDEPPSDAAARAAALRAWAETHAGDPQAGAAVFRDERRTNCHRCHAIDGTSPGVGPDLGSIGFKFDRAGLVTAVLEPSRSIAVGYGTTVVATTDGKVHQGILTRVTDDWIELIDKDAKPIRLDTATIESRTESPLSLMPDSLHVGLSPQEFTDLVAYLGSLERTADATAPDGTTTHVAAASVTATFEPAFGDLSFEHPTWVGPIPGGGTEAGDDARAGAARFVVLEQSGRAFVVAARGGEWTKRLLFDRSDAVRVVGATGLLGMAFHPRFADDRRYFVKYQSATPDGMETVVEERRFTDGDVDDAAYQPRRVLTIPVVTPDHNGGCLLFGPDGMLFIGAGDSGPQGDPQGHGQDRSTLLGKILRIDVDRRGDGLPYGVPPDNPFRDTPGARPEIWATGFREPWRCSFDPATGSLWVGDVGQNRYEEVTLVRAGENHGWNVFEGHAPHASEHRRDGDRHVPPVFSYPRSLGASVTGGHVYRGSRAPRLQGRYVCGDFESRRIWALAETDGTLAEIVEIGRAPSRIVSFAEDVDGELLVVGYDDGVVRRLLLDRVDPAPVVERVIADNARSSPVPWRFTLEAPPEGWNAAGFDDSAWTPGPGGFGSAGTPGAIVRTDWRSGDIWLRRSFDLPAPIAPGAEIRLLIHHDEDAEVFVNGVEAARLERWTQSYVDLPIAAAAASTLRPGRNVIAIHCRQHGGGQYIDAGLVQRVPAARTQRPAE